MRMAAQPVRLIVGAIIALIGYALFGVDGMSFGAGAYLLGAAYVR